MKIEKKMPNDRWTVPVPAEYSKAIGVYQGGPILIELDESSNKIILTSKEKDSESNLVTSETNSEVEFKEYSKEETLELIKYIIEEKSLKSELIDILLNRTNETDEEPKETCAHCGAILEDREQLRINGKRICSKCKKIEVQKFLFYLERRRLKNEKEKIIEKRINRKENK